MEIKSKLFVNILLKRGLEECTVESCEFASRHHRVDNPSNKQSESTTTMLYKEIMDSLHVYMHHLFHFGLRTDVEDKEETKQDTDDHKQKGDEHFDDGFEKNVKSYSILKENTSIC